MIKILIKDKDKSERVSWQNAEKKPPRKKFRYGRFPEQNPFCNYSFSTGQVRGYSPSINKMTWPPSMQRNNDWNRFVFLFLLLFLYIHIFEYFYFSFSETLVDFFFVELKVIFLTFFISFCLCVFMRNWLIFQNIRQHFS